MASVTEIVDRRFTAEEAMDDYNLHAHSTRAYYNQCGALADGRVCFSTGVTFMMQETAGDPTAWRQSRTDETLTELIGFHTPARPPPHRDISLSRVRNLLFAHISHIRPEHTHIQTQHMHTHTSTLAPQGSFALCVANISRDVRV
jgi:hypothetical protein